MEWMLCIAAFAASFQEAAAAKDAETLYNGTRLASPWPPGLDAAPSEPIIPPYLSSPPAVIPIDVGRQLFADDFLVAETTLKRTFHRAAYHPASPVLKSCKGGSTVKDAYGLVTSLSEDGIHRSETPILTGSCGERLYFCVRGRSGRFRTPEGVCSTGLAVLRRDEFASMAAVVYCLRAGSPAIGKGIEEFAPKVDFWDGRARRAAPWTWGHSRSKPD